jgi:hypothetical protein
MPPDPQRNARLLAKINFPISGKHRFFLLLANTLPRHAHCCHAQSFHITEKRGFFKFQWFVQILQFPFARDNNGPN